MTAEETRHFKTLYTIHKRTRSYPGGEVWAKITYSPKSDPENVQTIRTRWTGCQWDSLKTYLDNLITY